MAARVGNRLRLRFVLGLYLAGAVATLWLALQVIGLGGGPGDVPRGDLFAAPARGDEAETEDPADEEETDPIWINAGCYVCHTTFVREEISKVHLAEKVSCVKCHGVSAAHANDENVGATPPDIRYKRCEVDPMCIECHEEHDVPAEEVIARFVERKLPAAPKPICTDCHGTHKIERAEAGKETVRFAPALVPADP